MKASDRILARRYAKAFVLRAGENPAQAQARLESLGALSEALKPLRARFDSPELGLDAKRDALEAARPLVGADAVEFAVILLESKRFGLLEEIVFQGRAALDFAANRLRVQVSSAAPLDKAQEKQLEQVLSKYTGMEVRAEYKVSPELLGGVCIKAGDLLVENSVKGRLERLKGILQETGSL